MTDETRLRALLHDYARAMSQPGLTAEAWDRGRTRRRSRHLAGIGLAAVTTAVVVLGYVALGTQIRPSSEPAGSPTPNPSSTEDGFIMGAPVTRDVVQQEWAPERFAGLPHWESALPAELYPAWEDAVPLSTNPMSEAVVAFERDIDSVPEIVVLGGDGMWRRLDVGEVVQTRDAGGYTSTALQPNSIAPDQRQIAFPQPRSLLVVDVTDGSVSQFPVEGLLKTVSWTPDSQSVLVGTEGDGRGVLVDVRDGSTSAVPFRSYWTTFVPSGEAVEWWSGENSTANEIRTFGPDGSPRAVGVSVGAHSGINGNLTLVATDASVAIVRSVVQWEGSRGVVDRDGPLVADAVTGDPVGQLPIRDYGLLYRTSPLGWINDKTVVYRIGDDVVAWSPTSGDLWRVTQVFAPSQQQKGQPPTQLALSVGALVESG